MNNWFSGLVLTWAVMLVLTVVVLLKRATDRQWQDGIRWRPIGRFNADGLFMALLSANQALIEHDNFNQLASGLSERRAKRLLADRWQIRTAVEHAAYLQRTIATLGRGSEKECAAIEAWIEGRLITSPESGWLEDFIQFMHQERLLNHHQLSEIHLSMLAHDIQHLSYVARLGLRVGFICSGAAQELLAGMRREASVRYASWEDYSISALMGMALRNGFDEHDLGLWPRIARSHSVLCSSEQTLLVHAGSWSSPLYVAVESRASRPAESEPPVRNKRWFAASGQHGVHHVP